MCAQTRDLLSHPRRLGNVQLIPYPRGLQQKKTPSVGIEPLPQCKHWITSPTHYPLANRAWQLQVHYSTTIDVHFHLYSKQLTYSIIFNKVYRYHLKKRLKQFLEICRRIEYFLLCFDFPTEHCVLCSIFVLLQKPCVTVEINRKWNIKWISWLSHIYLFSVPKDSSLIN